MTKGLSIGAELVSSRVVNGDVLDDEVLRLVDREALYGIVLNVEAGDGGVDELVGSKEFWLGLPAVAALTIPPGFAVTIDNVARRAGNGNVLAREAEQGTRPLRILKSRVTLESNLEEVSFQLRSTKGS